jgi:hypothetical protein
VSIKREENQADVQNPGKTTLVKATTRRVFIFTLLVFCISPVSVLSDGQYSMVLSDSILRHHSVYLNAYRFPEPILQNALCGAPTEQISHTNNQYQLDRLGGNVVYCYPHGSSILSIPFVAAVGLAGIRPAFPNGKYDYAGEAKIQRLLAAILMAAFSCIIFRTSLLFLDTTTSLIVTGGAAFGTQVWSTASRTLWSHTWLIFLAAWVVYLLLRHEHAKAKLHPVILATLLSWMYFVRPTAAGPIACVTIYLLICHRDEFLPYAAAGASWFAAFVTYSWFTFGRLIPQYYLNFNNDWSEVSTALAGTLISPSRGLFVYVPSVGFVLYLLARYWRRIPCTRLVAVSFGIIAMQLLVIASWHYWWGGYSYGARYTTDLAPWFVLLGILGLAARSATLPIASHRMEAVIGLCLLAISVVINGRGATSWATFRWNDTVDIDFHPDRAFDWGYPQFMAGLIPAPNYEHARAQAGRNSKGE